MDPINLNAALWNYKTVVRRVQESFRNANLAPVLARALEPLEKLCGKRLIVTFEEGKSGVRSSQALSGEPLP